MSVHSKLKQYIDKALVIFKAFSIKYASEKNEVSIGIDLEIAASVATVDTGNSQNDLTELLLSLGTIAQKGECGVALFIDEI